MSMNLVRLGPNPDHVPVRAPIYATSYDTEDNPCWLNVIAAVFQRAVEALAGVRGNETHTHRETLTDIAVRAAGGAVLKYPLNRP